MILWLECFLISKKLLIQLSLYITKKIYTYGIRGNILEWFKSYLTDRSQFVIYGDMQSDPPHYMWCPSRLYCLLYIWIFVIYIWSVIYYYVCEWQKCLLSGKDVYSLTQLLNTELELLYTWLRASKQIVPQYSENLLCSLSQS